MNVRRRLCIRNREEQASARMVVGTFAALYLALRLGLRMPPVNRETQTNYIFQRTHSKLSDGCEF